MPYQTGFNNYQISKFIVTASGDGPFTTVQSAINEAHAEYLATSIPQTVFVRSGTYTENITHYSNVNIVGDVLGQTTIIGVNTINDPFNMYFSNLKFENLSGNLFQCFTSPGMKYNAYFENCIFNTNSEILHIIFWVGDITFNNCFDESPSSKIAFNDAGTANLYIYNSKVGTDTTHSTQLGNVGNVGGNVIIVNSEVKNPLVLANSGNCVVFNSIIRYLSVEIGYSAIIRNSYIQSTATCLYAFLAGDKITVVNSIIDSAGLLAIDGQGAFELDSVTFENSSGIGALLTITRPTQFTTGTLQLDAASAGALSATAGLVSAGTLTVGLGGTGATTLTSHGILMGNTTGTINATAEPSNGQLLIGSTGNFPTLGTLTAGSGITITNAAGSITLATAVPLMTWSNISASGNLAVNNGYNCTGGAALSLALPATSAVGDTIEIVLDGSTSFAITQGAGQQIRMGTVTTTSGAGGSITSTAQGDWIRLKCKTADTVWTTCGSSGNFTIV